MTNVTLKAIATTALIGVSMAALPAPASAGGGWWVGPGLAGFGIGAVVGSALAPRTVYVAPPPPPAYAAGYGPPPWSPEWYSYCASAHPSFNPQTGYFYTYSGQPVFCQ